MSTTPTSPAPSTKVTVGALSGSVVTVGVWIADVFGADVPGPVAAALVVIVSFGLSYVVRDRNVNT